MFTAHFVAYLWSLPELLRRGRTTHDHQGRQSKKFLFFLWSFLFPEGGDWVGGGGGLGGWEGRGSQTPDQKLANFSPTPKLVIFNLNYFANIWKTLSLKCFQIAPGTI